jgi:site-specific recombinase XerD
VGRKRSDGLTFDRAASNLRSFCNYVNDLPLDFITTQHVLAFLNGPHTSTTTWRGKHSLLRHFFEFWMSRGEMPLLLLPVLRPPNPQIFVPYVYTKAEIHTLLTAVRICQKYDECAIDAQTMRTFLLTLYATGALLSEILALQYEDVDLKRAVITIRSNRFSRSRRIPVSQDLREVLRTYMKSRHRDRTNCTHLFVTKRGLPIPDWNLVKRFQKLRTIAGIARHDGACYQPRMHDLRTTFAVHRITSWIRKGADLNRMLPALAAYMGKVGLASTEQYLSLTPERFRKELDTLSPGRARKHWRDDPKLMKFLEELLMLCRTTTCNCLSGAPHARNSPVHPEKRPLHSRQRLLSRLPSRAQGNAC